MKNLYILIFTLCLSTVCPLIINAQPYGINLKDKEWNYEKVEKFHKRSLEDLNSPIITITKDRIWKRIGDTVEIRYFLLDKIMVSRYAFITKNNKIAPDSKVIFQQASLGCGMCAEKLVQLYKSTQKSGFRHLAGNEYLSSYKKKTKLIMLEEEGKETCLTLMFIPVDLDKKAYKKLYRSLPKSN
ncbi:MAG: hypothetical protein IPM04_07495 [Saprospiraceae bacterium]|nr:hypothetical protein [Candidatus Brachybacter algidus]MBK8747704.1 hypothetical protein [Candidatus Brachybacter algidus]